MAVSENDRRTTNKLKEGQRERARHKITENKKEKSEDCGGRTKGWGGERPREGEGERERERDREQIILGGASKATKM